MKKKKKLRPAAGIRGVISIGLEVEEALLWMREEKKEKRARILLAG